MKESHREEVARHTDPESCANRHAATGEAWTGAHADSALSCEIKAFGPPTPLAPFPDARHFGKTLSWPYAGPRVLSSDSATYVGAVACTSRGGGQPPHIRKMRGGWDLALDSRGYGIRQPTYNCALWRRRHQELRNLAALPSSFAEVSRCWWRSSCSPLQNRCGQTAACGGSVHLRESSCFRQYPSPLLKQNHEPRILTQFCAGSLQDSKRCLVRVACPRRGWISRGTDWPASECGQESRAEGESG